MFVLVVCLELVLLAPLRREISETTQVVPQTLENEHMEFNV